MEHPPQAAADTTTFQLFPELDAATAAALRESIRRFGVLVPVAKDQHGRVLDGHQRSRIAGELGVDFRVDVHVVSNDDEARELAHTLNSDRRQLSADQRKQIVATLREAGHSLRAIAGAVGVSQEQVRRDVATVTDVTVPDRVVGRDGKSRPAKRTVVAAKSQKEAARAQEALAGIEQPPSSVIDVKRAERIAREQEAEAKRALGAPEATITNDVTVLHGDFREVLDDARGTVTAIITDPPYGHDFIARYPHQLVALSGISYELLRDDGHLVVMMGQGFLPDVYHQLGQHMSYRWTCCYLTPGAKTRIHAVSVSTGWKPIIVYGKSGTMSQWSKTSITSDMFGSSGDDKRHHHWGQNEEGIAQIVEAFTSPGDLVIDPFLGGGTTAVVCRDLGRRFIGCDIDAAAVNATLERLAA